MKHSDKAGRGAEELIQGDGKRTLKRHVDPFLNNESYFNELLKAIGESNSDEFLSTTTGSSNIIASDEEIGNDLKSKSS